MQFLFLKPFVKHLVSRSAYANLLGNSNTRYVSQTSQILSRRCKSEHVFFSDYQRRGSQQQLCYKMETQ